ncbi:MAG: hypothetical protein KJ936_03360 [Proteobacteria bacterium]|nr:hypothetical protein [Pseudomonadota bacterium]
MLLFSHAEFISYFFGVQQAVYPRKTGICGVIGIDFTHSIGRRPTIHIQDYELSIKVGSKWSKWIQLGRVYGIHGVKNSFDALAGGKIEIKNFEENLIYRKSKPVEYGQPLYGWIVFVGPTTLHDADVLSYRLTCTDAFRKKHCIYTKKEELGNLFLLQDMADITIPLPKGGM